MNKKIKSFLYSYSQNSRSTTKELGKLLKISQQSASYLVSSYRKKKIIRSYHSIIDPAKLGLITVLVYYNLKELSAKSTQEIISFLKNQNNIVRIDDLQQGYDLACTYIVSNLSNFNKLHRDFLQKFQKRISVAAIFPLVVTHLYPRNYLLPRKLIDELVVGGDRERINLQEAEMKVLHSLFDDPSATILHISQKTKLNAKTVIRIKRLLERKKVIRSYSLLWDLDKLGIQKRQILFNSSDLALSEDWKLLEFCKSHPFIVSLTRLIGRYDILLEVEGENLSKRDVLREIRSEFGIQDYKVIPITETIAHNYVPSAFFE